jgi:hypothetical protein
VRLHKSISRKVSFCDFKKALQGTIFDENFLI